VYSFGSQWTRPPTFPPSLPPSLPPALGPFLPNYQSSPSPPLSYGLQRIDHVVSNVRHLLPVANHLMGMTVRPPPSLPPSLPLMMMIMISWCWMCFNCCRSLFT